MTGGEGVGRELMAGQCNAGKLWHGYSRLEKTSAVEVDSNEALHSSMNNDNNFYFIFCDEIW